MIKSIILASLMLINFVAFSQRVIYNEKIPEKKIKLSLEHTRGGTVSQNLEGLQYIPLNFEKVERIGSIKSVSFLKDRIGIIDQQNGYFYIYNYDGTIVKRIKEIPNYKKLTSYLFSSSSSKDNHFEVFTQDMLIIFDKDGNIVEQKSEFIQKPYDYQIFLGKSIFEYRKGFIRENCKRDYALRLGENNFITYLDSDTVELGYSTGELIHKVDDDKAFVTFNGNNKIFQLNQQGVEEVFDLIFPLKNTIDTSIFYKEKGYKEQFQYFQQHPNAIYGIGNIIPHGKYIIVYVGIINNSQWLALDFDNEEYINLGKILPDQGNDYLNFFDFKSIYSDNEYLYSFIYPIDIRQARLKSEEENHHFRDEYVKLEKFDNPILVKFKLKQP